MDLGLTFSTVSEMMSLVGSLVISKCLDNIFVLCKIIEHAICIRYYKIVRLHSFKNIVGLAKVAKSAVILNNGPHPSFRDTSL